MYVTAATGKGILKPQSLPLPPMNFACTHPHFLVFDLPLTALDLFSDHARYKSLS